MHSGGTGGIQTSAIQSTRIGGAAKMVSVDRGEFKQKLARQLSATHKAAIVVDALNLLRHLTYGIMADAVVISPLLIVSDNVHYALMLPCKSGVSVLTGMASQLTWPIKIDLQDLTPMNKMLAGNVFSSHNPQEDIFRLARIYPRQAKYS
ncbi:hypothetical protein [Mycobacterium leprae]|uniref:hypothetical protein n=2 Tax=Mycobacterium leprae TaxID=1769 RepID=UPI000AFB7BC2